MTDIQQWLNKHLVRLNLVDEMDYENGFSRPSFSSEEKQAHEVYTEIAKELGLHIYTDEAGNRWATWHVDFYTPTIALGSHLDTVYGGGGYDGVAGVLTALGAIKLLQEHRLEPRKNIAIICFASEESARFGVSTIGSKAISGLLPKEELESVVDSEGITLKEAIETFGLDWNTIDKAEKPQSALESFVELHIEQGTQIEDQQADVGIVRGVACPIRLQITCRGMANHTGTTPMNKRADAFTAIAPLITYVEEQALQMNEQLESPLVATVSTAAIKPNAMNVIPGEVQLGIDIRSVNDEAKHELAERITHYCKTIEQKRAVAIDVHTLVHNDSVFLDNRIQQKLQKASDKLQMKWVAMDSGAGHDVMNMANKWPSGLLFIPCTDGISHHPKEHTSLSDLEKGTRVIAEFLQEEVR
ncbi:M20 family metallo-hydrolase [Pontibacillus salicampi]|uniref:M20 family metallo-hydrolase n=1 Tax=Pontibacillus salicampi TaxID=1449801 RepID=A0ABV6LPV8_9BACI